MRIFMPAGDHETMRALSDAQVQQFIEDGFIRIDRAFPRELADAGRAILWRDTGCDPDDPQRGENRSSGSVTTSRRRSGRR